MATEFAMAPIAWVRNARTQPLDDDWDAIISQVELAEGIAPECLAGLDAFSHVEIVYVFDRVRAEDITWTARHPRNNPAWPRVGILAQRGKNRPNRGTDGLVLGSLRASRREQRRQPQLAVQEGRYPLPCSSSLW